MMRKPVFMGAGLGLLVLALVAGGFWVLGNAPQPDASAVSKTAPSHSAALQAGEGLAETAQPAMVNPASPSHSSQASQERRKRLAELRAEFNTLRAQGMQAPPEKMRALVDEMEAVSPPGFDPRYFQTLRNMLDSSARLQTLNNEQQALSKSTAPKDQARQEDILAQMRALGARVNADARNLQLYAPTSPSGVKSP